MILLEEKSLKKERRKPYSLYTYICFGKPQNNTRLRAAYIGKYYDTLNGAQCNKILVNVKMRKHMKLTSDVKASCCQFKFFYYSDLHACLCFTDGHTEHDETQDWDVMHFQPSRFHIMLRFWMYTIEQFHKCLHANISEICNR